MKKTTYILLMLLVLCTIPATAGVDFEIDVKINGEVVEPIQPDNNLWFEFAYVYGFYPTELYISQAVVQSLSI